MLELIQDPSLKSLKTINHGIFTRKGGVSTGLYASLNCDTANQDRPENARENRRRAMAHIGYPLDALISVRNVHGNTAVIVDKAWTQTEKLEADGMATNLPNIVLGSDSADCPIVLFADDQAGVIGLAHAGWRSAKGGILDATLNHMISLGAKAEHISAAISPCIAQTSYEVNPDLHQQFLADTPDNQRYFKPSRKAHHFFFDLPGFVKDRLLQLGLKSVSSAVAFDTYSDEARFFSYRRATHRKEPDFGGHLSWICLV